MLNTILYISKDLNSQPFSKIKLVILTFSITLLFVSCIHKEQHEDENEIYTCSMDPQVREHHPGKCPICHMALTKVSSAPDKNDNTIQISDAQRQLANIKTELVEIQSLGNEKNLSATVMINQNLTSTISSKISGRIDKLFIKTIGEKIIKGQLLYEIYSEQLVVAQKDYLNALQMVKAASTNSLKYKQLMEGAKQKLILWGLNAQQINTLERSGEPKNIISVFANQSGIITEIIMKEGDYLMEGNEVFKLADISSVWVEAQLYASEAGALSSVTEGEVSFSSIPDSVIKAKLNFTYPELLRNSKIIIVRLEIQNPNQTIKPGMQATITIRSDKRDALAVPGNAIIQNTNGDLVWIKKSPKVYEPRMVQTGMKNKDYVEIFSGLEEGDDVVTSGSYLLQSEYIFKKGKSPMMGMPEMKNMETMKMK